MRVLVVEDEKWMAEVLQSALEEEHYSVSVALDGNSALDQVERDDFDLIVLDVMLPGINGWEVARKMRQSGHWEPVLMLTARDAAPDVVKGLDAGADDYLTKPFSLEVLFARLRALSRRPSGQKPLVINAGDLVVRITDRRVFRGTREINLTPKEFRLLEFLMNHQGRVAQRPAIVDYVWGPGETVEPNTLDAYVRLLRRKVDHGEKIKLIQTIRGLGYSIDLAEAE
jgi:two-component system, OmpR family, response regulator